MHVQWLPFDNHGDDSCRLIAIESGQSVPFPIKRIYFFTGVEPGVRRGGHAHKTLQQVFVCQKGSCRLLLDDGRTRRIYQLNDPCCGLYIKPGLWRELYDFSPDAVVSVLADQHYNEEDYIRSYDSFLKWVGI